MRVKSGCVLFLGSVDNEGSFTIFCKRFGCAIQRATSAIYECQGNVLTALLEQVRVVNNSAFLS